MAPPKFSDLNKQVGDVFNKGYYFNSFKLDVKTRTQNGVNFNVVGEHNTDTAKTSGSLETKYVIPKYGLTFLEKWTTDNLLKCEITADDQVAKGVKVVFDASLLPNTGYTAKLQIRVRTQLNKLRLTGSYSHSGTGNSRYWKKTAELRTTYTHDRSHVETNVTFDNAGPIFNGAIVFGFQRWLLGYQYAFNTARSLFTKNNFAVSFKEKDFTLYANMNDGNEVGGSLYQQINDQLETGVQLAWNASSNQTRFAIASKYQLDNQTTLGAKINNSCQLGLSFQKVLKPGVKLTLSSLLEAQNMSAGGHKIGFGLELD